MCHVSELMNRRVENVTDLVQEGDMMAVKVLGIDDKGKVKLSRKAALREGLPAGMVESLTGSKAKELLSK